VTYPSFRRGVALAALALLTACGLGEKREAACPQGIVPADSATVTRFRDGPGRDLTDVIAEGEIVNILVQCRYDKRGVTVDLQVAIAANRGPADRSRVAEFDYFVALVDPEQNILAKEPFRVKFEFRDNRTRLGLVEELEPRLPLADVMKGPEYRVLVGFQLTPEELAWNRSNRPLPQ
jgi:hypothetical protein